MSDTDKQEEHQEEKQPEAGAGFGKLIINDDLVQVIRHPENIRREEEQKKEAARKEAERKAAEESGSDAA